MNYLRLLVLVILVGCGDTSEACVFWRFGKSCEYPCFCIAGCSKTGECVSGLCPANKFGQACQFYDRFHYGLFDGLAGNDISWLTDKLDDTCYINRDLHDISLTLYNTTVFTWLRIVSIDLDYLPNLTISFLNTEVSFAKIPCMNRRLYRVSSQTVDIHCPGIVTCDKIVLGGVSSVCSLYVNGGHQVNLHQKVYMDSTDVSDTVLNFVDSYCVTPSNTTVTTRWTSTFPSPVYLLLDRSSYSILQGSNASVQMTFLDDNSSVLWTATYPATRVSSGSNLTMIILDKAVKTIQLDSVGISLCELTLLGDCFPGKWGLSCDNDCHPKCPTSCHIENGLCNAICIGYSDPPLCTKECEPGAWGINCEGQCDPRCSNTCNRTNGACDGGSQGQKTSSPSGIFQVLSFFIGVGAGTLITVIGGSVICHCRKSCRRRQQASSETNYYNSLHVAS